MERFIRRKTAVTAAPDPTSPSRRCSCPLRELGVLHAPHSPSAFLVMDFVPLTAGGQLFHSQNSTLLVTLIGLDFTIFSTRVTNWNPYPAIFFFLTGAAGEECFTLVT